MKPEPTEDHYRNLASSYDSLLHYSSDFVRTLSAMMIEKLKLGEDDRLVDIGGGTGIYSADILRQIHLRYPVTVVDPSEEMLAQVPKDLPLECVQMDALDYSRTPGDCDKILMKESVHHVDDKAELFANLGEKLTPGGVLLLVHIPPRLDYPLFEAALRLSESWHADPNELVELLHSARFDVETDSLDYEHHIPKYQYFQMVRSRYMSMLSSFSDDELDAGLAEMERTYAEEDILHFTDHFDFLTATKH